MASKQIAEYGNIEVESRISSEYLFSKDVKEFYVSPDRTYAILTIRAIVTDIQLQCMEKLGWKFSALIAVKKGLLEVHFQSLIKA